MPRIFWDQDASRDLDQIWDFIGRENQSPDAADRLIDSMNEMCKAYARQPEMGTVWPELAPRVRFFSIKQYVVFYRPTSDGIEVVRVLHGARNIEEVFRRRTQ